MSRINAIVMLVCLALAGCVSTRPASQEVSFSYKKLPDASPDVTNGIDRNLYADYDEAYLVTGGFLDL